VLGLMQSLNSGALIVGPLIAGYLIEHGLLTTWGLAAAATAVMGLFLASQGEAGVKTRGHVQTRPSGLL